ncbi:hypothetical protein V8D89_014376 [Ganoderma adspersum]
MASDAKTSDRNSNAKGQRSPSPTSKAAALKAQVELFKPLDQGDPSSYLPATMDESSVQSTNETETLVETTPPSFHGNFDLYAMELPFLNSAFIPERDYAALLKVLRHHQAKPDNSAQIYFPDDFSTGTPGRIRCLRLEDPLEGMPHKLALHDTLAFTARETTEDALYSAPPPSTSTATPGMRRAWVSADGKDEVFEGFFSTYIVYSRVYRRKTLDKSLTVRLPFWGIRARVGPDGRRSGSGRWAATMPI